MQLAIPLSVGGFNNSLQANSNEKKYGNVGMNIGLGLALRGYTRSPFSWYVQGLFNMDIPYWPIRESGFDKGIKNTRNEEVKGGASNFVMAVGVTLLFGEDIKKRY